MSNLVLSLFPGIGLLDRAFEAEGFCVVRGPDVIWGSDVRQFHPPARRFEGVIGGPPCQSFTSLRTLIEAHGHAPRHGNLIPEFERVVAEAKPEWFVMENHPRAPMPGVGGYSVVNHVLDNHLLGEEQGRIRRFSFGSRWDIEAGAFPSAIVAQLSTEPLPPRKGAVTSSDGGKGVKMDRYKLPEMLRLQGLPQDFFNESPFTMDGKRKMVANGVPIAMGRAVARAVKACVSELPGAA